MSVLIKRQKSNSWVLQLVNIMMTCRKKKERKKKGEGLRFHDCKVELWNYQRRGRKLEELADSARLHEKFSRNFSMT